MSEEASSFSGINTFNEKSLHAELKRWYAQEGDQVELPVDGYIIDLVRGNLLIEIQTGSFSPLKRKLTRLCESHPVRLVYPIAIEKWIVTRPAGEGQPEHRRKSPRRGRWEHVFTELVYIPALLEVENFTLEVLLIREEERRRFDGKKGWRRKGWVTEERRLIEVVDRRVFNKPADLAALVPAPSDESFTARDLAKKMGQPAWLAYKVIYCLRALGLLYETGKRGRSRLYTWTQS